MCGRKRTQQRKSFLGATSRLGVVDDELLLAAGVAHVEGLIAELEAADLRIVEALGLVALAADVLSGPEISERLARRADVGNEVEQSRVLGFIGRHARRLATVANAVRRHSG